MIEKALSESETARVTHKLDHEIDGLVSHLGKHSVPELGILAAVYGCVEEIEESLHSLDDSGLDTWNDIFRLYSRASTLEYSVFLRAYFEYGRQSNLPGHRVDQLIDGLYAANTELIKSAVSAFRKESRKSLGPNYRNNGQRELIGVLSELNTQALLNRKSSDTDDADFQLVCLPSSLSDDYNGVDVNIYCIDPNGGYELYGGQIKTTRKYAHKVSKELINIYTSDYYPDMYSLSVSLVREIEGKATDLDKQKIEHAWSSLTTDIARQINIIPIE